MIRPHMILKQIVRVRKGGSGSLWGGYSACSWCCKRRLAIVSCTAGRLSFITGQCVYRTSHRPVQGRHSGCAGRHEREDCHRRRLPCDTLV